MVKTNFSAIFTVIEQNDKIRLITRNNAGRHCWDISPADDHTKTVVDENLEDVTKPETQVEQKTTQPNPVTRAEISGHLNDQLWSSEANQRQIIDNTILPKCDVPLEVIFDKL